MRTAHRHPIAVDPESDKVTRMATQAAKIEAGQVFLPRSAAWLDEFKSELLQFPHGRYDDQVDSLSQFLAWVGKRRTSSLISWDFGYGEVRCSRCLDSSGHRCSPPFT